MQVWNKYDDWNHKRAKTIIDYYGYTFFHNKKILDLGAGHGSIAASLVRLGADVLCIDARQENLNYIQHKYPFIKTMLADIDHDFLPLYNKFDMVLSLDVLCHIKNFDKHIKEICGFAEHIILETEVLDSPDPKIKVPIYEEKSIHDLSFHGEGSIVSASNIQSILSELGASYKRIDDNKLNSGQYKYDWKENGEGRKFGNRRFWFIRRDRHFAQMLEVNAQIAPPPPTIYQPPQPPLVQEIPIPTPTIIYPNIQPDTTSTIRLFYNHYVDDNPERYKEIEYCYNKNKENKLFDLIIVESKSNPTFDLFFQKINDVSGPNDINIICNSDIFLDDTISLSRSINHKEIYALTCWEYRDQNNIIFKNSKNSQDTWIFRGKIENVNGNFPLGKPGCEGRIAYEFHKGKYKLFNPSMSIKTYHFHNSNIRRYSPKDQVPGPHIFITPTILGN